MHPELLRERLAALEVITESLDRGVERRDSIRVDLAADDVSACSVSQRRPPRAGGPSRGEGGDRLLPIRPDDPNASVYVAYGWLTQLEDGLVETLLGSL